MPLSFRVLLVLVGVFVADRARFCHLFPTLACRILCEDPCHVDVLMLVFTLFSGLAAPRRSSSPLTDSLPSLHASLSRCLLSLLALSTTSCLRRHLLLVVLGDEPEVFALVDGAHYGLSLGRLAHIIIVHLIKQVLLALCHNG